MPAKVELDKYGFDIIGFDFKLHQRVVSHDVQVSSKCSFEGRDFDISTLVRP